MANPGYVRFSDGVDTDNGSTWALANKTAVGAMSDAVAGDTIWFSQAHAEASTGAHLTITCPGTPASPCRLLCGDDSAEPPVSLASSAVIEVTGNLSLNILGSFYARGIKFFINGGLSGSALMQLCHIGGSVKQVYASCFFDLGSTSSSGRIWIPSSAAGGNPRLSIANSEFKFGQAFQGFAAASGVVDITNCKFSTGSVAITILVRDFGSSGRAPNLNFSNCDFSLADTALAIANTGSLQGNGTIRLRDCKMPTSWSGSLISSTIQIPGFRVEMYNCDSGDTNYTCWIEDFSGSIRSFSTLYLSGTDGIKHNGAAVPLSYKMTGSTNACYLFSLLEGMWMPFVNETTTSQTATLEIIHNESANLTDEDIWLELDYPATSGVTQFARIADSKSDILATATAQDTSTADWDDGLTARANSTAYSAGNLIKLASNAGRAFICTTGGTSSGSEPAGYASAVDGGSVTDGTATFKAMRRQKLSVSFTAAEQGVIRARAVLTKAGAVVWVASKLSMA